MKMPEELEKMLNEQVKNELNAGYIYLSMAAWFESKNLPGSARWMKAQSKEELGHAMKIFDYLYDRGARATLLEIPAPKAGFESSLDAFKTALGHEQSVTAKIQELYELSVKTGDTASTVFLQWFVNEQVEEEKTVEDIIARLSLVKEDSAGMFMLDRLLGERA